MDALYFFVIATVIATFGISYFVRKAIKQIAVNLEDRGKIHTNMFIGTALVEIVPIVLIVFGYVYLPFSSIDNTLPLIIVILSTALNLFLIYNTTNKFVRDLTASNELKGALKLAASLGYTLVMAIPIVSVISMFIPIA